MTISSTTNRVSTNGNGSTTAFPVTFPFHAQADLVVISTVIATGVQTTKSLTTHYTISGSTDSLGHYSSGGSVNFLTAPASTERITIYRDPTRTQGLDLQDASSFPAENIEAQLDYMTMLVQRVADLIGRTARQPDGDSSNIATLPSSVDRASMFLAFNASGDPIAAKGTSADLGPVTAFINTLLDDTDAATARTTLGASETTPVDSTFRIVGSSDATKKLAFEVDGFTTGVTRSVTPANQDLSWANIWVGANDFRLSLTTAVPVTTADVTAAGTLYAVPCTGNRIALYNGTAWLLRNSAQFSLALTLTSGKPYDVFCYDNAGTPTLEVLVWTNDTTRATALTRQDGVLVKSGDTTRRYLGSLYSSGANTTEDSLANRYLWNYYHRRARTMRHATETANTWNYTTATFRQANNNTANQLNFIVGVAEEQVQATVRGVSFNSSNNIERAVGIGLDSTTVDSSRIRVATGASSAINIRTHDSAEYREVPVEGKHSLVWIEISAATGTTTWIGDDGGVYNQTGMYGTILA